MTNSGWADILELLFWTGIFEILAKTLFGCQLTPRHPAADEGPDAAYTVKG